MGLFSLSSRNKEVTLIVDVGSASVGASLVLISPDSKTQPTTIESVRVPIKFQERFRFNYFVDLMLRAVETSVSSLIRISKEKPVNIHCFIASPWYASQVRKISLKKDKEFIFDEISLENEGTYEKGIFQIKISREQLKGNINHWSDFFNKSISVLLPKKKFKLQISNEKRIKKI